MTKRLLVSLVPAIACLGFATPALASTQAAVSENWAGYVAGSDNSGFSAVSAAWTQPRVDCSTTDAATYSAYWVGLGGGGENSNALEQIGTQADCSNGSASYYAWYELVPSAPVELKLSVQPGDQLWARTAVDGNQVSFYIRDRTTGQTWTRTLTMTSATPDTSTAEWVTEAPSECQGDATGNCTPLTLADFGTAKFTDAYTTSDGHTGAISDSDWTTEAIELAPSSSSLYGGGPGGYLGGGDGYSAYGDYSGGSSGGSEGAAPTSLSDNGTAFSVEYGAALATGSSGSGEPQSAGYTDGYGSTGNSSSGYGSSGYSYGGYGSDYGYGDGYSDPYGDGGYGGDYGGGGYYGGSGNYGGDSGYSAILNALGF